MAGWNDKTRVKKRYENEVCPACKGDAKVWIGKETLVDCPVCVEDVPKEPESKTNNKYQFAFDFLKSCQETIREEITGEDLIQSERECKVMLIDLCKEIAFEFAEGIEPIKEIENFDHNPFAKRELTCQRCGCDYPVWFTDNELWNAVCRIDGKDAMPFLCLTCFTVLAEMLGFVPLAWVLSQRHPLESRTN